MLARWLVVLSILVPPGLARAALLEGVVRDASGKAVAGALVTLYDGSMGYAETVYSDPKGAFRLQTAQTGAAVLRVRAPGHPDDQRALTLAADTHEQITIPLGAFATREAESDSLTASAHVAKILARLPDDDTRKRFEVQCVTCHMQGAPYNRGPRDAAAWRAVVQRMHRQYVGVNNPELEEIYVRALTEGNDGKPVNARPAQPLSAEAQRARVIQYPLGEQVLVPHDSLIAPDGLAYTIDQGSDTIFVTDLRKSTTKAIAMPKNGHRPGGKFAELGLPLVPSITTSYHGPHGILPGPDGRLYLLSASACEVAAYDPRTGAFEFFPTGGKGLYPHTGRFDADGVLWYTLAFSNQVARLDPKTKTTELVDLPAEGKRAAWEPPILYGLDVNPTDGSVWYSKLYADRIGRIDAKTREVREFDVPLVGPRRMRFSKDGMLWIPAFGDGTLVRLDPRTMEYTSFPLPKLSPEDVEMPYAVAVEPRTQDVWVTSNMSDRAFRFLARERRFVVYPMPSRFTYTRDISFTKDGWACSVESNFPVNTTEHGDKLLCVDPGDAPRT